MKLKTPVRGCGTCCGARRSAWSCLLVRPVQCAFAARAGGSGAATGHRLRRRASSFALAPICASSPSRRA